MAHDNGDRFYRSRTPDGSRGHFAVASLVEGEAASCHSIAEMPGHAVLGARGADDCLYVSAAPAGLRRGCHGHVDLIALIATDVIAARPAMR